MLVDVDETAGSCVFWNLIFSVEVSKLLRPSVLFCNGKRSERSTDEVNNTAVLDVGVKGIAESALEVNTGTSSTFDVNITVQFTAVDPSIALFNGRSVTVLGKKSVYKYCRINRPYTDVSKACCNILWCYC